MKQHPPDAELSVEVERLVEALRADLPTANDAARIRGRLMAAGVLAAGLGSSAAAAATLNSSFTSSAAAEALNLGTNAANIGASASLPVAQGASQAASASAGLLAKVIALPAAVKVSAGGGLIALALGAAPALEHRWQDVRDAGPGTEVSAKVVGRGRVVAAKAPSKAVSAPLSVAIIEPTRPATQLPHANAKAAEEVSVPQVKLSVAPVTHASLPTPKRLERAIAASAPPRSDEKANTVLSDRAERAELLPAAVAKSDGIEALNVSSLNDETPLISRALQALKVGDNASARDALGEHERRFPSGLLSPERERARAKLLK